MKTTVFHLVLTFLYHNGVNGQLRGKRHLQALNFLGVDPTGKLQKCQGDCDTDDDCAPGLFCFQRERPTPANGLSAFVPGCGGEDFSRTDYCFDPADLNNAIPTALPTSPPQSTPPPTPNPTQAITPPPTPSPTQTQTLPPTPAPTQTQTPPPTPAPIPTNGIPLVNYGGDPPSSVFPLPICTGDCDVDDDCAGNLVCLQREKNEGGVPGCSGIDNSKTDYCILPPNTGFSPPSPTSPPASNQNLLTNFKLKLYWEQGYFWQEESFERKWCMRCRNAFCDLGDKVYIEGCNIPGVQRFDFAYVNSEEVMIVLHGTDKCLERLDRDIFVVPCDDTEPLQRWFAKVGQFEEFRFEISQLSASDLCVTQRHHPKPDEEVELEPCGQARWGETSFWQRCYTDSC